MTDSWGSRHYRYLIKENGRWRFITTFTLRVDWPEEITDVIWLKSEAMVANWWRMRDGERCLPSIIVDDSDLVFTLLQVER